MTLGTGTKSSSSKFPNAIKLPAPTPNNKNIKIPATKYFLVDEDFFLVLKSSSSLTSDSSVSVSDFFRKGVFVDLDTRGKNCVASGSAVRVILFKLALTFISDWINSKLVGLSSGFLLIVRRTRASSIGGIFSRKTLSGIGSSSMCFIAIVTALSPVKGKRLVIISYITTPKE